MFKYYLNRGLDAVEVLAKNFSERKWILPDLICDDVLEKISQYVKDIDFYHINENLTWEVAFGKDSSSKVFYTIDYFGSEVDHGRGGPPNTIVIRDSVWFPYPFSPVEPNHIWFNSLRKILHAERGIIKGSNIISPYRISGLQEVPNLFYHPSLAWDEMCKRFDNYFFCKEIFEGFAIIGHEQQFPSIFPIRLKDRERILSNLDVKLPGMWKNRYKLPNKLYDELAFIPLDSRYNRAKLTALADKIKELANAVGNKS